ncbi:lasso RiPP family leader peptide-containing protein [Streptococcus suis]|uniref:Uncharacterized protein n=1 Tax=Streptococcus suis TaxID=1307 RepID=A0A0Z8G3I4_STRSU|nr:lasso RiPP family leader peptide-containing protein [Streptococcus suis]NQH94655.1 lasso RiPP family leader peptide-containing protein [Streptococcus suis]CYU91523.1 Uncharacterised protein [Streptococcus suis]
MYQKPTITKIGSYRTLTNGAGGARERDLLGFRALMDLSKFQKIIFVKGGKDK